MPIVTISRGSYTRGRKVAELLAEKMGYECIAREVLIEASEQFNIPEIKLRRALHDAPSVLDRFSYGRQKYLSYIRADILRHMVKDNVVYHGLAGHAFVHGASHLLRIRIRADMDTRVREEMKRENISEEEARYTLNKDDEERRKWSIQVVGIDPSDSSYYDLIFNAGKLPVEDIVDTASQILKKPYLQATPQSQNYVENLSTAAEIKVLLVNEFPGSEVTFKDGTAHVTLQGPLSREKAIMERVREIALQNKEVQGVQVHLLPSHDLD